MKQPLKEEIYLDVFGDPALDSADEYVDNMSIIDDVLSIYNINSAIQTLKSLFNSDGLYDGDIPSTYGRDVLLEKGFCSKSIKNKEWGYQVCTYRGAWAMKVVDWMDDWSTRAI